MSKFEIEFKWALYFTAFNALWLSLEKVLGWHDELIQQHAFYSLLIIIPQVVFFYLCIKAKRDDYFKGEANWQQLFVSGGVLALLIAALSPAVVYYMNRFLSPDFIDLAIDRYLMSGGKEAEAKNFHSLEAYIKNGILFNVSMGIVIAGPVAYFLKKKKPL
ncbi:DUF4199 domain-containing protein [Psychroflexus maritimus]|uniref:DUF4199 domain-containing protein n=1 Tax=Psychroflexus maritimus TaxID=2714865 RepID=A0A967AFD4_9FLAO|nr:DUF4199 domain-containing protein [Psychroflexus maritimus]NGZ89491.1 DUF4199 domain-containing protein [Psychroflexus maritimus]